jgi:hypothetical protein
MRVYADDFRKSSERNAAVLKRDASGASAPNLTNDLTNDLTNARLLPTEATPRHKSPALAGLSVSVHVP